MRVLVTRPEPGASRTASRLAAMGHEPVVLPLSETRALAVDTSILPDDVAAVAVTSANALRHAPPSLIERLAGLPCHAVGHKSAEAARTAGFAKVEEGPGDALGLASTMGSAFTGRTVLYLCGRLRFSGFEERLAASGVHVCPVETYETVALDPEPEAIGKVFSAPVDAVLLYSVMAAEGMERLLGAVAAGRLDGSRFLALSPRVATALKRWAGVASEPTEDALLALLKRDG